MQIRRVWTFFYGSYMNFQVLNEVSLVPENWEVGRLAGFDIRIAPRANLVPAEGSVVYGILATATHEELDPLYSHARQVLGEVYLPEAVLVETLDGRWRAALLHQPLHGGPSSGARVCGANRAAARENGFPDWYVERLEGLRP